MSAKILNLKHLRRRSSIEQEITNEKLRKNTNLSATDALIVDKHEISNNCDPIVRKKS